MDWKEDLKLSIKKTVAKKGRRSSQQQQQQQQQEQQSSSPTQKTATTSSSALQSSSNFQVLSTSPPNVSSSSANSLQLFPEKEDSMSIDLDVSIDSHNDQNKTPPRKITGGWADSGSKSGRKRSNLFEEERFNTTMSLATTTPKEEDIPIIPDLDDMQDELLMNEIVEPPSVTINRVVTLKELDSDLLKQSAFSTLEDVDLTILTKHLQPQEMLDEPDEVWEWDQVFTQISAEIHSETSTNKSDKAEELIQTQYIS